MKRLLLLIVICLPFMAKAQVKHWLYLNKTSDGQFYLVDTLQDDIQQLQDNFEAHDNVVIVWTNMYKKALIKGHAQIISILARVAVDTTNKQYEFTTYAKYQNGKLINSGTNLPYSWQDAIPGSMAEDLIKYVRSLNNKKIHDYLTFLDGLSGNPYHIKK